MRDVKNRADVYLIVKEFYSLVREEPSLGPIFNQVVRNWEEHFNHLTDFWESNVFMVKKYAGNPIKVHQQVDKTTGGNVTQEHFEIWLKLWFQTIDNLFEGDNAQVMKNRARNMSSYIFIQIVQSRGSS